VELIIAMSLTIVLFAIVGSAINVMLRAAASGKTRTEHARLARALIRNFESDLRCIEYRPPVVEEEPTSSSSSSSSQSQIYSPSSSASSNTTTYASAGNNNPSSSGSTGTEAMENTQAQSIGVFGTANSLQFSFSKPKPPTYSTTTSTDTTAPLPSTSRRALTYCLSSSGTGLMRREEDANAVDGTDAHIEEKVLADEVKTVTFRYFNGSGWDEAWDSASNQMLPSAIEMTLGISFSDNPDAVVSFRYVVDIPLARQFTQDLESGL
jgi:hypothetical protein